jgi:hypothetical protein
LSHQRQPAGELVLVVDVLHRREERVLDECLAPRLQIPDVVCAMHEAHVRNRVEEAAHVGQHAVLDGVGPELARHLELLVDVNGLADVDGAVGALRGVVQLTQRGVPGARVVPRIAALGGRCVEPLDERDRPVRLQQTQ